MNLLREKIELAIVANCDDQPQACLRAAADAILAIPEILDALALVDDYVPPMTNEQMRAHLDKIFQA
jgi:hypothetical protein